MKTLSLTTLLGRLIWLCVLPPVILAVYFAVHEVRALQDQDSQDAENQVRNIARDVDSRLQALILPLQVLAASSSVDDPPRLSDFYNECKVFQTTVGVHVILADTSKQMLLNTREPYGASLPKLPPSKGHAAAPAVLETGKPAVGDIVFGPVANKPLVAVAVPVIRDDRIKYLLLSTIGTRQFQQSLDHISIPEGWVVTVFDGANGVIARRSPLEAQRGSDEQDPGKSFVARSAVSRWSVVLKVPQSLYASQIMEASALLAAVILAVTFISVASGRAAARRLTESVAGLAEVPPPGASQRGISEIEAVRKKLEDSLEVRDKAVAKLQKNEEKLRVFIENAPTALAMFDREMRYLAVSHRWMSDYSLADKDIIGRSHYEIFPEIPDRWKEVHRRCLEGEIVRADEDRFKRIEGPVQWQRWEVRPWHDYSGAIGGIIIFTEDITEQKMSQRALRDSEQRYRAIFDTASVGIDLVDQHGKFLGTNKTLSQFIGYTPEELQNLTIFDVTHPEDKAISKEMHETIVRGQIETYRLEKRYLRRDGTTLWSDTAVSAIRDADGQYRATVGVIRDITSQKESEDARNRLATAVEQAVEGIVITDTEGTIQYVNPAYERITGYSRDEVIGQKPMLLRTEQGNSPSQRDVLETLSRNQRWSGHLVKKRKDGVTYEEEVTVTPVLDPQGKLVNFVVVKRDVTKESSLQRQLLQAQKMEAVGTLAGGIAHDFNNILQVALGYSELLLTAKSKKDPEYDDLQKIRQAARSGADLVANLLTFSRKVESTAVPMDLNNQIQHIEKLLHRTIPRMIDIRLELADDLKRINADSGQIEQIVINLAVNARDAMGEKGTLTIQTENVFLDQEYCRLNVEAKPGEHVMLSVSDTGSGMDRETVQHIFEPFYTTKELGRGTGLGLAMVYGIIKQHEGHITCCSELGKGTKFRIYLPAILSAPEEVAESVAEMPAFGTETLLLVDDEDALRNLGERILTKNGYTVISAANGVEALAVYAREKEKISLIILDLIMPAKGGKDCLHELLKIDPAVKVLIASGYSAGTSKKECVEMGAKGFVGKPFRIKDLLLQVRKTLDEK